MVIEGNGIAIDASVHNKTLHFRIVKQNKAATDALKMLGIVTDKQTGLSMRSNKHPSWNKDYRRFFVRGKEKEEDEREVKAKFSNPTEAHAAIEALQRLVAKVQMPQVSADTVEMFRYAQGGTSGVRFAVINNSQAKKLDLTNKGVYPKDCFWIKGTQPVVTRNRHYNEHIGQAVDVLNKAYEYSETDYTVNPHKVTHKQGTQALEAVRKIFNDAEKGDYLVALWRLVTGIRGPDFEDEGEEDD